MASEFLDAALYEASKTGNTSAAMLLLDAGADPDTNLEETILFPGDAILYTPLVCASLKGYAEIVKLLLVKGANVHINNDAALLEACKSGHVEIVKILLAHGADPHCREGEPLCAASEAGHYEIVKLLLAAGASVHAQKDKALQLASWRGHIEVIKELLNAGADVNANDDYALIVANNCRNTEVEKILLAAGARKRAILDNEICVACGEYMEYAFERGDLSWVKEALSNGADVHAYHERPLRTASANGNASIVETLLRAGADVHASEDEALRRACKGGHIQVVKTLLKADANVHARNEEALRAIVKDIIEIRASEADKICYEENDDVEDEDSCMEFPFYFKVIEQPKKDRYLEILKILLAAGANVHVNDDEVVYEASLAGLPDVVEMLITAGADLGRALYAAECDGNVYLVKRLLELGADFSLICLDHDLSAACFYGHLRAVKVCLDNGCDVHDENDRALRMAAENGDEEIVKLLLNAGADIHANNDEALRLASEKRHREVVKILLAAGADKSLIAYPPEDDPNSGKDDVPF